MNALTVPAGPVDPDPAAAQRRRRVVAATAVVGAGLLGGSLAAQPGSPRFFGLTTATAVTWVAGGLASGPLRLGWTRGAIPRRPVVGPVLIGVSAFGAFYGAALVAKRIPPLDRAITSVLRYAEQGTGPFVLAVALVNGAAEEVFFRGALYAALDGTQVGAEARAAVEDDERTRRPGTVALSTAAYVLATTATRNPALVLASAVMGALFAVQRRATGGIQAPLLTHVTWSALMLRFLPPLFHRPE